MQTFVPYDDPTFVGTMRCLDTKRLGKQRVETYQILRALQGITKGWVNHPATRMWRGYETGLTIYLQASIEEWLRRGYKNTMSLPYAQGEAPDAVPHLPPWWGNAAVHASHRARLLDKNFDHYSQYGWSEQPGGPEVYVWPV